MGVTFVDSKHMATGACLSMEHPVDQGWAWVVLFSSFMCLLLTCGALYSVGVFNMIFLEAFGASPGQTAWVGSLLIGLLALMGPVSSALTNKYGWRTTVILGGVIAGVGTFASAWATRIEHLFVCFGIVSGIGHGLAYTPAVVVVSYYFDRLRTAATGLASVGAGLSMLIFPPLLQKLLASFTWRESLVICSCFYLHICVFGALMRPLTLPCLDETFKPPTDSLEGSCADDKMEDAQFLPSPRTSVSSDDEYNSPAGDADEDGSDNDKNVEGNDTNHRSRSRSLKKKLALMPPNVKLKLNAGTLCSHYQIMPDGKFVMYKFVIFCISIFMFGLGLSAVYLHLPAFAVYNGASREEASLLLSVIGGMSIVSRVFTGLAGNDKSIENTLLYIGTFGISGVATLLAPWLCATYIGRMLYAIVFGFYGSSFNVLLSPITVEIVGLRFLTTAFGVEMVVCGVSYLLGPPLAGALYDMTGTYDTSFYVAGSLLIVSSTVMMFISMFNAPAPCVPTAHGSESSVYKAALKSPHYKENIV